MFGLMTSVSPAGIDTSREIADNHQQVMGLRNGALVQRAMTLKLLLAPLFSFLKI